MSYANPLEFRPAAISAGKGAYLTVELGKATTTPVGHGILGLNDFEFKAEFNSDADAGISSWENILGPRQSTIPDFSASWSGYYTTTNSENVALTGTGDDYLGFTVNGQAQATSFTPQAIPAINKIGVIYYNSPGDASLRDVSLDYTRYFLSPLNAARFLNDSEISAHEPASDSISELFTIHADSFADHTVYLKSADISPGSRSGIDTEAFTRGGETTNFGDDYRLYWGKSGLTSPSAEQLTLIQPNGDSFTWGTSAQDESVDFQQISIYAEILSDNFAEQHQAAEITAWGGAGKVTYEWTAPQSDNTSFWRAIGEDFYNTTYLGGQWSGPYAVGGSGAYLSETVSLAGFGGRIELDVLFGDSWDGESLQIYVNGNNFNFSRIYSSQVGQSTQSNNGYIATLYPYNDYGQTVGAAWNDQTARVSIEIPIGVTSVTLGAGETLDQAWSDEFLGIDNLAVIEPEVTTYTLKAPDDDPVLSLGRVGYLDSNNNFIDTNGSITEGVIGVVEIEIADEAGNSALVNNPIGLYVHYMVSSSAAVEGDDFFAPKGVMSTKDYSVTDFIKVDPGSSMGYLYISAKEDAIVEGEEELTITLLDNIWTTDNGLTYQNYVIGDNASVNLNIADADGQRWSQGVSFSQQGRTDSYIRADEDGSSNIDVKLKSQPEGIVTLNLSTGDALTFTDEDWDTPQTISVILSDNTNGGEAIKASSSDGEWSGSGFVNSYTDPLVPAVVLYEGGQIVEEGTRVAVTAQEEIVEGSSSKTAALTFSRVSQDSSATFEVFFTAEKTTEGSAYTNPAILTGEKIRSYQPLVLSDDNAPITYTGNTGAGATGGAYTIEFWINPTESNGNNISPISLQDKYGNKTSIEISGDGSLSFVNRNEAVSALLDGADDYLLASSPDGLPVGGSSYTIQAWIKTDEIQDRGGIVAWGKSTKNKTNALRTSGNYIDNYHWSNDLTSSIETNYADGIWHQITATYDAENGLNAIYFDGELVGSGAFSGFDAVASEVAIGRTNLSNELFKGEISNVRLWSEALTEKDVEDSFQGSAVSKESLVASYLTDTRNPLINSASTDSDNIAVSVQGSPTFTAIDLGSEATELTASRALTISQWQHIAITRSQDAATNSIFVNGKVVGTGAASEMDVLSLTDNEFELVLGGAGSALIRDVRIFDTERSEEEVKADMLMAPATTSDLIFSAALNGSLAATISGVESTSTDDATFSEDQLYGALFGSGDSTVNAYINSEEDSIDYGLTTFAIEIQGDNEYAIVGADTSTVSLADNDHSTLEFYKQNNVKKFFLAVDTGSVAELIGNASIVAISNPGTAGLKDLSTALAFGQSGGAALPEFTADAISEGLTVQGWIKLGASGAQNIINLLDENGEGLILSVASDGSVTLKLPTGEDQITYVGEEQIGVDSWNHWSLSVSSDGIPSLFLNAEELDLETDLDTAEASDLLTRVLTSNTIGTTTAEGDEAASSYAAGFRALSGERSSSDIATDMSQGSIPLTPELIYAVDTSNVSSIESKTSIAVIVVEEEDSESWSALSSDVTLQQSQAIVDSNGTIANSTMPTSLTLGIALSSQPFGTVSLSLDDLSSTVDSDYLSITIDDSQDGNLVFTAENWDIPQSVTLKTTGESLDSDLSQVLSFHVDSGSEDENYISAGASLALTLLASLPSQPDDASPAGDYSSAYTVEIGGVSDITISEADSSQTKSLTISLLDFNSRTAITRDRDTLVLIGQSGKSTATTADIDFDNTTSDMLSGLIILEDSGASSKAISVTTSLDNVKDLQDGAMLRGYIEIKKTGYYTFYGTTNGNTTISINEKDVLTLNAESNEASGYTDPILLDAGSYISIAIDQASGDSLSLQWIEPDAEDNNATSITSLSQVGQLHVVIPAGEGSASLVAKAIDDDIAEGTENFTIELQQEIPYQLEFDTSQLTSAKGMQLEDQSSYLSLPGITTGTAYTIAGWINLANANQINTLFYADSGTTNADRISLRTTPTGAIQFGTWNSSKNSQIQIVSESQLVDEGVWHHLVASVSEEQATLYLDGVQVGSQSLSSSSDSGLRSRVRLGYGANSNESLSGFIRDYQLFNQALSADDVKTIYSEDTGSSDLKDLGIQDWYSLASAVGTHYGQDGSESTALGVEVGSPQFVDWYSAPFLYTESISTLFSIQAGDSLAFGGDTSEGTSGEWILEFINDEELVQGISSDLAFRIAETSSQDILPDNTTLTAEHVSGGYQLPTTSSTDATGNATEVIEVGKIQGSISIEDNDSAGFFISGGASLTLTEGGGSSMRSLNLTSQPLDSVTLYLQAAKEGEITLSAAEGTAGAAVADTFYLTFTEEDWSTPQEFYIQAVNNQTADGERNFNLHITSASDDSNYHKLSTLSEAAGITPFDITIDDDDTAGLDFVAIANNITKAANGYVYVALATQPNGDVTLTSTPKDGSFTLNDRSINRSEELVFTSANWNVPQSLELTAIDDSLATGTQVSQVDFEFSSKSDSKYTGSLAIDALNVYIIDNDLPTASIISVLDATENARPGAFKIILDEAAPEDPGSTGVLVNYSITGFDLDQYLQSITLSDGTVEEFPITDEDGDFDGDNASEADLLKALGIYTISPGGNLLGSVRIAPGESESNIFVIPIDEIFADKYSLDTGTSQTGRTGKRIGIELTQSSNTDPLLFDNYQLSADASKRSTSVDIINNDVAGVAIISSGSLLQTSEDLGYQDDGATFAVVLLTQPQADVLISINEAARIEAESLTGIDGDPEKNEEELTYVKNENGSLTTGSGNTMTFTAANWYIPQTATVVAKADNMIEDGSSESGYSETGIHSTSIAFVFNSADTDYDTSYNQDDTEHFTANTSLGVLIQDQSLPTTTAEALSSTLDSLQSGFESLELPFLGKMDGKFGSPFSSLFSELIPNIRSLGDQLTAKRLQNVLNDYFSNVIVELQEGASVIDVSFEYDQEYDLLSIPLDAELGIPALGLQASGSIDSSIALATKLGLQVPFATDATSDIAIRLDEDSTSIGAQLDLAFSEDFELDGGLGFLQFNANNQDSPRNDSATGLSSEFTISLAGSDATTLSYADLSSKDFNLSEYVDFTFPTDAGASSANLSLHVNTQSSAGAVMPSVDFDLTAQLPVFNYGDTDDANSNVAQVYFDNINLDIGSFATDMLLPAVQVIGDVLDPIKPLVDAFYTDTKIFDALGMTSAMDSDGDGIVTPLDMLIVYADNFGTSSDQKNAQKAKIFLSTLQQVYSVIDTFESLEEGEGFGINLGDYSFELAAASKDSSKSAAAQPRPVIDSAQDNTKSTALSVNDKIGSAINELYALGFSIPLIESPSTAVSLLMGQDIDLFTWTMPGMSASLSPSQTFNLYPAPLIQGTIGGEFGAEAFITLGFDTSGFSAWADTGFALDQSWRAFDGFFVDDWDSNGNDRDEVTVSADLGVDVSASIALAKASAGGGVSANMGFDLIDSGQFNGTSDGKLRASEIFSRISNPLNLFELTGDLSAYLDGSVKVGVDLGFYKKWWTVWSEQFDFDLFSFSLSGTGSSSNGPIQDATVFFDANSNGRIDASESATTTLANGTYADLKLDLRAIDTNRNGLIDAEEGRLVAFGGTDTIGSIPVDTVMFAPYGSQINPLSSLYTTALGAGFTTQEAMARVQSLFSIEGWDFTQLDPTRILRELADTSTEDELSALAKQAAIAHSFLNWSFSKLIVQAEKIKGIASLSIGEKIALSESFLQRLLAEDEQDVSTGMAEKISRSLLQEWRNYADVNNLGQDLLPDKVMLSSQIKAIQAAHAGVNISDEQSAEEFLDELASVKSTYFMRSFLSAPLQSASDLPTQVANPAKPSPQPRPASDESYDRPSQAGQLEVAPGITIRFDTEPDVQLEFSAEPLITPDPNGNFSFSTRDGQTISLALPDGLRNEFAGVIAFDVTGLKPGASTTINLSIPSTLSIKENASGAYIRFNYDANRFEEFVDPQGNPLYNFNDLNGDGIIDNVSLLMQDGDPQWDGDGAANGRVVDPGTIVTGEIDFKGTPHKDYITGNILSNTLKGSRGNDRILGDLGRDTIWGGRGHDRIHGGEGGDILIGGRGRDRFIYTLIEESNPFQADTIRRLRSNDAIDLRSIDANMLIEGRQNFLFIEKEKFSGTASELRATRSSLQADIDGDGKADFVVNLVNSYRPNADQILL